MTDTWAEAFALVLRALRKQRGLTLYHVAAQTGLARESYRRHEAGRYTPSLDALERLARFHRMSVRQLVGAAEDVLSSSPARCARVRAQGGAGERAYSPSVVCAPSSSLAPDGAR